MITLQLSPDDGVPRGASNLFLCVGRQADALVLNITLVEQLVHRQRSAHGRCSGWPRSRAWSCGQRPGAERNPANGRCPGLSLGLPNFLQPDVVVDGEHLDQVCSGKRLPVAHKAGGLAGTHSPKEMEMRSLG